MIEKKRVINWSITECVWMVHQYITTNLIGLINYHHSLGTFYTFDTLWHFWLFFCKNDWIFVIFRVSHFHGWYGYQSIQYDQTWLSKVFLTSKIVDNGCFRIFCKNGWIFVIFRVSHFHGWYGYQSIQYDQTRLSKVFLTSKIADNGCFRIFLQKWLNFLKSD